jgi:putative FmdB family regulatory protein
MPTYEYVCRSCGTHVEVFQRFKDAPLTECGVCGGPLRKVFHPAGILFKGSGFYATDSRQKAASKSTAEEPKKERKDEAKEPAGGAKEKAASTTKEKSA